MNPEQTPVAMQPIENIHQSAKGYAKKYYLWFSVFLVILIAVLFAISAFNKSFTGVDFIGIVVAAAIFGYPLCWKLAYGKAKDEFMHRFALSHGFDFSKIGSMSTVNGKLFSLGGNRGLRDVLTGTYQNRPIRIYGLSFSVSQGKSSRSFDYTVFESTFESPLPDIILSPKKFPSIATPHPFLEENFKLEGDFNKYFDLYVPKNYELEAEQLLPPNVMATLIDKASDFGFEFSGNKLYIYTDEAPQTTEDMQKLFDFSDYLIGTFTPMVESIERDLNAAADVGAVASLR